jgi:hypothetical protein
LCSARHRCGELLSPGGTLFFGSKQLLQFDVPLLSLFEVSSRFGLLAFGVLNPRL